MYSEKKLLSLSSPIFLLGSMAAPMPPWLRVHIATATANGRNLRANPALAWGAVSLGPGPLPILTSAF